MRFHNILIVTYGRSGSTLLQGILNALPNVLVRGENHDFCWGLYTAWKSLVHAKSMHGSEKSRSVDYPWFGAADLDPERFLKDARKLLQVQLGVSDVDNQLCWGFKEIRYLDHLDELHEFLDFLSRLLPDVAIVFNTRSHDAVCDSAFWKKEDSAKLRIKLQLADRLFLEYAERHQHAFVVRYEHLVLGLPALDPFFAFLGIKPDSDKINALLDKPHSYAQKPESIELARIRRAELAKKSITPDVKNLALKLDIVRPLRPMHGEVLVACVVKDERERLPYFLHYYRGLGCRDFLFIDNGSTDGTIDYLQEQPDVILYHAPRELYAASHRGRNWLNFLGPIHALHSWMLNVNVDELLAWPGCEQEGFVGLIKRAERMGLNRVFTPMIDVYPDQPCEKLMPYEQGKPFSEWAKYIDQVQYAKVYWDDGRLIINSGPRMRFKQPDDRPPIMSKQKLYFVEIDGYQHIDDHLDNYKRPSPLVAPLLHYKFMPKFEMKISKATAESQPLNTEAQSNDYYQAALRSKFLKFEGSLLIRTGDDLHNYITSLSNVIRESGLCGSVHLETQ